MNRFAALATTLTIAGTALLAPAASADPTLSVTSAGVTMGEGSTATVGQTLDYNASGCTTPTGGAGYIGQFVDFPDRPELPTDQFEALTANDGSFSLQFTIPEMPQPQHLDVHWYCSATPATSLQSDFLWLSPSVAITIQAAQTPENTVLSLRSRTTRTTAAATANEGVTVYMDPDALPLVDKMGIVGVKAAALKAKVDAKVEADYRAKIAALTKQKKPLVAKDNTNATYVRIAFQLHAGVKAPTASQMAPYIARLDAGALRVQVVEDIALTKASAKQWNK